MNRVEEKINITNDLKKTLAAVTQERDDSIKMIGMLKEELRLQETHYNNTSGTQAEYYSKIVEKTIQDEKKITELMTKLQ